MAFITGSHAYGKPTEKSDVDLVILVEDYETIKILRRHADKSTTSDKGKTIRFGKLNIIITESAEEYAAWLIGTRGLQNKAMERGKSYKKKAARKFFDKIRNWLNIDDDY